MEVIRAECAGFCFGVKRALKLAREAVAKKGGSWFSLGPLIHNPQVVAELAEQGVRVVTSLAEVPRGGGVIISSHGTAPETYQEAKKRGIALVDATCPFVRRVQRLAQNLSEQGHQVVVVGDAGHPEVKSIVRGTGENVIVVRDAEEAKNLPPAPKTGVVAQTTQQEENLRQVVQVLHSWRGEVVAHNTICHATRERQEAARKLAEKVDVMLVIGGYGSANTRNLVEICRQTGTPTYHLEESKELNPYWFQGAQRVGVTAGASTPDWIIEEVIKKMTEMEQKKEWAQEEALGAPEAPASTFEAGTGYAETESSPLVPPEEAGPEKEEAFAPSEGEFTGEGGEVETEAPWEETADGLKKLRRGEIITGTVVQVGEEGVLVDTGGKSEGIIPFAELSPRELGRLEETLSAGEKISVYVLRTEDEEGRPVFSKKRADRKLAWGHLEEAYHTGEKIEAEVVEVVKGGLLVDVGVRGFVPSSQVERGYVENLSDYLGKVLFLRVIELDRGKNKVVLSRKVVLEEEQEQRRQQTWETLEKGQLRKGIVRRLTNFGAFVDLGGVDGLLHVSQISWGRVEHPRDVLKEGEEIEVIVLGVDRERGRVSLGLKQLQPNPWETAASRYQVGSIVPGKVLRLAPFGAFVEVEPGIEGLVHISQLAEKRVERVEEAVAVGEEIPVKVLSIDEKAQRISLSLKEAQRELRGREGNTLGFNQENKDDASSPLRIGDLFYNLFEEREVKSS